MAATLPLDTFRADRTLAESIVRATRPIHAQLNKLIVSRLPLALPPSASSPLAYASGMMHIAPIYAAFEGAWSEMLDKPDPSTLSKPMLEALKLMYLPGLMRARRIEQDVQSMMGWTQETTKEKLDSVAKTGHLEEFISHIRRVVKSKPHVLMSYSYVFFMGLFAGGRFLRSTLESAGDDFWWGGRGAGGGGGGGGGEGGEGLSSAQDTQHQYFEPSSPTAREIPVRFFRFDTPLDGEDLKLDFKQQLADAEGSLSYQEKYDIVQEAICIFQNMMLVVAQLDDVVGGGGAGHSSAADGRGGSAVSLAAVAKPDLGLLSRIRDSVVVTRERQKVHGGRGVLEAKGGIADDGTTPVLGRSTRPSRPENHATMALGAETGAECAAAASKSVRFEKCLSQTIRNHVGVGASSAGDDVTGGAGMASSSSSFSGGRLRREQVTNWAIGLAMGLILLGAVVSGRLSIFRETP